MYYRRPTQSCPPRIGTLDVLGEGHSMIKFAIDSTTQRIESALGSLTPSSVRCVERDQI